MDQPTIFNSKPDALPPGLDGARILSAKQGAELLGVSIATFRRLYWAGEMPPPLRVSARRLGWPVSALLAYAESRRAA